MNLDDAQNLLFTTDEKEIINIDSFLMEKSASAAYEHFAYQESEDETIARHLLKVNRIWLGYPEPHYILPHVSSRNGELPPYVITAWLSRNSEIIVVVFHVDLHPDKTIEDIFQMYLHQIHFDVLAGIDADADRKMFDWWMRD